MAGISNAGVACGCEWRWVRAGGNMGTKMMLPLDRRVQLGVMRRSQDDANYNGRFSITNPRRKSSAVRQGFCTRMALIDKRIIYQPEVAKTNEVLAYHLVQGDLPAVPNQQDLIGGMAISALYMFIGSQVIFTIVQAKTCLMVRNIGAVVSIL